MILYPESRSVLNHCHPYWSILWGCCGGIWVRVFSRCSAWWFRWVFFWTTQSSTFWGNCWRNSELISNWRCLVDQPTSRIGCRTICEVWPLLGISHCIFWTSPASSTICFGLWNISCCRSSEPSPKISISAPAFWIYSDTQSSKPPTLSTTHSKHYPLLLTALHSLSLLFLAQLSPFLRESVWAVAYSKKCNRLCESLPRQPRELFSATLFYYRCLWV